MAGGIIQAGAEKKREKESPTPQVAEKVKPSQDMKMRDMIRRDVKADEENEEQHKTFMAKFLESVGYSNRREKAYKKIIEENAPFEKKFWRIVQEHNKERCINRWAKTNLPAMGIGLVIMYCTWESFKVGAFNMWRTTGHPLLGFILGEAGKGVSEVAMKDTPACDWARKKPDLMTPEEKAGEAMIRVFGAIAGAWDGGYLFERFAEGGAVPGIFSWDGVERTVSGVGLTMLVNAPGERCDLIDNYKYWRAMAELLVKHKLIDAQEVVNNDGAVRTAVIREIVVKATMKEMKKTSA